ARTAGRCAGGCRAAPARTARPRAARPPWNPTSAGSSPSVRGGEDGAAEDVRRPPPRLAPGQQRDERLFAVVVAGMAARSGHAAAEDERAVRVVEHRLAGRLDAEPARFGAFIVAKSDHAFDLRGLAPEIGVVPAGVARRRLQKQDVGFRPGLRARQDFRELVEAGARARTLRVSDEHERRRGRRRAECAVRGPARGRLGSNSGAVVVRPQGPESGCDAGQPDDCERGNQDTSSSRAHYMTLESNLRAMAPRSIPNSRNAFSTCGYGKSADPWRRLLSGRLFHFVARGGTRRSVSGQGG